MHIPDGFLSPQTYLPALAIGASLVYVGYKKVDLELEKIPMIAGVSAISFVMMLVVMPFPGGTTMHLSGIALLALLFRPWLSFLSISLVLLIQALMFGGGGVSSYPVNMLLLAFVGSFSAHYAYGFFKRYSEKVALFMAGWFSIFLPSLCIAVILGIQPLIATSATGSPLFFPFGLELTLPSIVLPHLFLGLLEGAVTVTLVLFLRKRFRKIFDV